MITISDILGDIQRGILAHNMNEDKFTYRITYFVYEDGKSIKHCVDTSYNGLRNAMVSIIRKNLSVTNSIIISAVTVRKDGKSVYLLNRKYSFNLEEYFQQVLGNGQKRNERVAYRKCKMW